MWITTESAENAIIILIAAVCVIQVQRHQNVFWFLENVSGKNDKNQNMMKAVCLLRNFYTQPCSFFSLESVFSPQPWPNLRVVYLALNGRLPPTVFNSRWLKREIQSKQGPLNPFDEFEYLNLTTHFQDWFKLYRYHMVKNQIITWWSSYDAFRKCMFYGVLWSLQADILIISEGMMDIIISVLILSTFNFFIFTSSTFNFFNFTQSTFIFLCFTLFTFNFFNFTLLSAHFQFH